MAKVQKKNRIYMLLACFFAWNNLLLLMIYN